MKNYIAGFALLCSLVVAQAAPPSEQSIEKMLQVMQVQKMLDQIITQMDSAMQTGVTQGLQGQTLTPAQKGKLTDFQAKLSGTIKDELSLAKTKDIYVQVYRETFTQDEINSIIAFYSSPAGKAMVEKVPVAMQKVQAMTEEFEKEMAKAK